MQETAARFRLFPEAAVAGQSDRAWKKVGSSFSVLVTLPADAVEGLDPATERVFVALTVPSAEHEDRQLRIPAFA